MGSANDDLIGGTLDAARLAAELRAARVKIDELTQAHRRNAEALGRIASAAGVLDFETLKELADAVVERLRVVELVNPTMPPSSPRPCGLACEACGDDGAVDMDGAVLCRACSGEDALAERLEI
jgi:hypothetical protein